MIMGGAVSVGSVLIVVYVGSVLISSLFVTMMLDLRAELKFNFVNFSAICFVLMLTLLIDVTSIIVSDTIPTNFEFVRVLYSQPNIVVIGYILYTWYVVPLILCAFIPLVAMMGTIVLLLDFDSLNIGESGRLAYSQNISLQVATHDFAAMELRSPLISYPTSVARYRLSRVSQRY
jgi:NADH:ubiquinone oxidoreductase subunit 6 (subunit J)